MTSMEENPDNYTLIQNFDNNTVDSLDMHLLPRIFWDILFSSMIFVAVVGNLIVLWIVTTHRYMRTIPNAFIANMSLSDLLMAVLNCSFNYVTMRDRKWEFGQTYCTVNNFIAIVSVAASVLNLTAMSLDRYKAIVWPLKVRTNKYVVALIIFAIWLGSALFALPAVLLSESETIVPGQVICYIKWPDDHFGTSFYDYIYNVAILIVTYVSPIVIIGLITIHMTIVLWCREPLCIITPQLERAKKKKQKIVKMLVVLIVIFGVCWLPYHVYFLYSYHFPEVRSLSYIQHVFLAFYWCAMAHSMVNPIVYYFMNPKFRHYYRHILLLRWLKPNSHNAPTGLILASTFGLQVAAHLAYGNGAAQANGGQASTLRKASQPAIVVEESLPNNGRKQSTTTCTTQVSSLASSTKSVRRGSRTIPTPTELSIMPSHQVSNSRPAKDGVVNEEGPNQQVVKKIESPIPLISRGKMMPNPLLMKTIDNERSNGGWLAPTTPTNTSSARPSPITPKQAMEIHRRFSEALSMAMKTSNESGGFRPPASNIFSKDRNSMVITIDEDLLAEDLLDITKENEIEIAATAANEAATANQQHGVSSAASEVISINLSLFPRITQV